MRQSFQFFNEPDGKMFFTCLKVIHRQGLGLIIPLLNKNPEPPVCVDIFVSCRLLLHEAVNGSLGCESTKLSYQRFQKVFGACLPVACRYGFSRRRRRI